MANLTISKNEDSFKKDYVDQHGRVLKFCSIIKKNRRDFYHETKYFSPYMTIFQSSGFGKTRLIKELMDKHQATLGRVVYACLRDNESTGFPPASTSVRQFFENLASLPDGEVADRLTFFLKKVYLKAWDPKVENSWEIFVDDSFWKTWLGDTTKFEFSSNELDKLQTLQDCQYSEQSAWVTIALDEARLLLSLFSSSKTTSVFRIVRQTLSNIKIPIFLLLLDTASTLSNFSPSTKADSSARKATGHLLFEPFFRLSTWDALAFKKLVHTLDFFHLGRPLWKALPDQTPREIQLFACFKLLGGLSVFDLVAPDRKLHVSLATLGARLGGLTPLRFSLASELVAGYMATCVYVAPDRESITATYPSEPALASGAALAMKDTEVLVSMLKYLRDAMQNGEVNAGYRGELVGRLLLLLCYDCCCQEMSDPLPMVPLQKFLEKLGIDSKQFSCNGDGSLFVRFNHFIPLSQPVLFSHLQAAATRGAALHFKPGQSGGDEGIPILNSSGDVVGALSVQEKNLSSLHDKYWPQSATSMLHCDHIYSKSDVPDEKLKSFQKNSVGLYLQLGAPALPIVYASQLPSGMASRKTPAKLYDRHAIFYGCKYPFLDPKVSESFRTILSLRDQSGTLEDLEWWNNIFPLDKESDSVVELESVSISQGNFRLRSNSL